jgi:DNA-directed RNA polymerase subunit M/transcription elongation factor TFIIS
MEEPQYTRAVVKWLLEHDRDYLSRLLGVELSPGATTDTVCAMIANHNQASVRSHVSSIYVCKCGSKMVVSREVQLRSADEGSSILHTCGECGHTW